MNGRASERTNDQTSERANKRMSEQTNERTNERTNEGGTEEDREGGRMEVMDMLQDPKWLSFKSRMKTARLKIFHRPRPRLCACTGYARALRPHPQKKQRLKAEQGVTPRHIK